MRILRDGEFFATGDDLPMIAELAGDDLSRYSFHPDDLLEKRLGEINARCEEELQALRVAYPYSEVLTWDKQEAEARAGGGPLIDALSAARGIDKQELITRIITKADAYAAAVGEILGRRQAEEDALHEQGDSL